MKVIVNVISTSLDPLEIGAACLYLVEHSVAGKAYRQGMTVKELSNAIDQYYPGGLEAFKTRPTKVVA